MRIAGDPETVRAAARALAMASTEADSTRTGIERAEQSLVGGGWSGEAASQFSAAVLGSGSALRAYAGACGQASQTLAVYADDLEEAQAAVARANALADEAGAVLDDEGLIADVRPELAAPGASDRGTDIAAAQNAGREAFYRFKNAAHRAVAGLHAARHELMPQYSASTPNGIDFADWAIGLYTAGYTVANASEYTWARRLARRRAYYWSRRVGETKGARLAKLLADRASARSLRFADTARTARQMAGWPAANRLSADLTIFVKTGSARALEPALKRVPILGLGIAGASTYQGIREGGEPITEVTANVGSLVAGAFATQAAVAGLVALGMAGAAPVIIGAAVGAAVAWGVGEGIRWLAQTRAGQDAIHGVKEAASNVADGIGDSARAIGDGIERFGRSLLHLGG